MNNKFIELLRELLCIDDTFRISGIERLLDPKPSIHIYLDYRLPYCEVSGVRYKLYDYAPVRIWQHLSLFQYPCFIVCRLPRYIAHDGKVKTLAVSFADKGKSYTRLFSSYVIDALHEVKVQNTVARLFHTSPYIVRSIMEDAVNNALESRCKITDLRAVSIDEKSFKRGHNYATILIDSLNDYVVDLTEGRAEEDLKSLFYSISSQEEQPQLERVNIDMWRPYINVIEDIAPQAMIVHDKFHIIKKLSEAIDKTRRQEVKTEPLLKNNRFTVLKNHENRTQNQQSVFEQLDNANLKTAQAWHVRENFKSLFRVQDRTISDNLLYDWMEHSKTKGLTFVNDVIKTIKNHARGVVNAIITRTDSGKHENLNGRIQAVLAKARGFKNFDRFRINVMFYFGKLNIKPLKIY
jgi:transposase